MSPWLCYFLVYNIHLSNSSLSFIFLIHQLFQALFSSSCYTSGICPSVSFSIPNRPNLLLVLPLSVCLPRQPEEVTLSHLTDKSLSLFDWPVSPIPSPYIASPCTSVCSLQSSQCLTSLLTSYLLSTPALPYSTTKFYPLSFHKTHLTSLITLWLCSWHQHCCLATLTTPSHLLISFSFICSRSSPPLCSCLYS